MFPNEALFRNNTGLGRNLYIDTSMRNSNTVNLLPGYKKRPEVKKLNLSMTPLSRLKSRDQRLNVGIWSIIEVLIKIN